MKLSVVIPIYNVDSYLSKCLDSLVPNLFEGCEVILVNDGSTDCSLDICNQYVERYPNFFRLINKTNGGLSDARNAGTLSAQGKYIYYLDSDDWLAPSALSILYNYASGNRCEVVQAGFYYAYNSYLLYDDRYIKDSSAPFILTKLEAMYELIQNHYIKNFAWGKIYQTDIVKKYCFPKGRYFEDAYWQHYIIHETNRYGVIPEPLYFYRQRESSISGAFSIRNLDLLKGYKERLIFLQEHYQELTPIMLEKYRLLAIQQNEFAISHGKKDVIDAYAKFMREEDICYSSFIYRAKSLFKRIFDHFFSHKLKRISYDGSL